MPVCKYFKLSDISSTKYVPKLISDYISNNKNIDSLYGYPAKISSFASLIKNKQLEPNKRNILVNVLNQQATNSNTSSKTLKNIELLRLDTTYSITTGHQPSLFLGPAYFIYKIIHTIKLCNELSNKFNGFNFVPIYWMATEDHDFNEINSINLFNKKLSWHPGNIDEAAIGRLTLKNIDSLKDSIYKTLYKEIESKALIKKILDCYSNNKTLAQATREAINILFGKYGLIVLDADNAQLKKNFSNIINDDLINNNNINYIEETSREIKNSGYKVQLIPQKINFFYLNKEHRKYFIKEDGLYKVKDLDISFSPSKIINLIDNSPELFSPNVALRPLYQESILPNIAYIGGSGEISYWLQLKKLFMKHNVEFPMLVVRNSTTLINKITHNTVDSVDIDILEILNNSNEFESNFIQTQLKKDFSLDKQKAIIDNALNSILSNYSLDIDYNLERLINAEKTKILNSINKIEGKIIKHSKNKIENLITKLDKLKHSLLPNNVLQERSISSIFAISQYDNLVDNLYDCFAPLGSFHYIYTE